MSASLYKVSTSTSAPPAAGSVLQQVLGPVAGFREIVTADRDSMRLLDLGSYLAVRRPAEADDVARLTYLGGAVGRYAESSQAAATVSKHAAGWAAFERFCTDHLSGREPDPTAAHAGDIGTGQ